MKRTAVYSFFVCLGLYQFSHAQPNVTPERQEWLNQKLRLEAQYGRLSEIEKLIREGADVNSRAEYGETALYYSILFGRIKTSLRLIQLGANPNTTDEMDRTPLLKAAEDCNYRVVDALLKAGAHVNHADYFGRTPLINASEASCVRAVAVILNRAKNKVNLNAQDHSYQTAWDYARHPWIENMLGIASGKETTDKTLPKVLP